MGEALELSIRERAADSEMGESEKMISNWREG